jgi:glycosyltransferase involved in cell wall biosynthesis
VTRLVFVTQQVDPLHPALAATVAKVRALAERVDEVVVIAAGAAPGVLPPNCRVHLFDASTRAGRGARFEAALARELRPRPDAVVAHMAPLFAILAAPVTLSLRIPLLLWFTHWKPSRKLRLAERLATAVLSVDERTFPLPSSKLVAIGHGIDVDEFTCTPPRASDGPLRALALGRTSPAKGLEVVIRGCRLAGLPLELRGPSLTDEERGERARLERLAAELGADVRIDDPVPRAEVPALLARHDVLVNNMRPGATDKVVFEACASCVPAVASNPSFDGVLEPGLLFERDSPESLAAALAAVASADRAALGRRLRERVERDHSVGHWADAVLEAARR